MTIDSGHRGRRLYEALGNPRKIVAPMVDQSELAWRILSRRYGADLCYTPMFHARLFATDEKYRNNMWSELDGDETMDRPLIVQFCANDPDYLFEAAKLVEHRCDGIDLNLGCPQGIAKKGKYGAFLMDDWDLVHRLIRKLHDNLKCGVTAKIRIYDDREKLLAYAKMVLDAGAQFLTVHGRTRDMKGQKTGLANWQVLRYLRDNLPENQVFFSNGNVLYPSDISRCTTATNCDAVMSAEGNLYNPGVFWTAENNIDKQFARVDVMLREYFEIVKTCPGSASRHAMKAHFFKLLHAFLAHHKELRPVIGGTSVHASLDDWEAIVGKIEQIVQEIYLDPKISEKDVVTSGEKQYWGGAYMKIPYWRCQPYFRTVDGVKQNTKVLDIAASKSTTIPPKQLEKESEKLSIQQQHPKKRRASESISTEPAKRSTTA